VGASLELDMPLRVVLDTNTVLSALLFKHGRVVWLRQRWCEGRIIPLISETTEQELVRVLNYPKFKLSPEQQGVLLADYLDYCERVEVIEPLPAVPNCRDPKDMPFLWLARAGNADFLVTGDQDLLVLVEDFPVPILKPEMFEQELEQ